MIAGLLTDLAPRVTHAELVRVRDETLSVTVEQGGTAATLADHADALHVRLGREGRLGWAAGSSRDPAAVVDAAFRSVDLGPPGVLLLPAPSPLPAVVTRSPATASLGATDLVELAGRLRERLARRGRLVETWAERSAGAVEVGNGRGVLAGYDVTLAGVGAVVGAPAADAPRLRVSRAGVAPPGTADLEALVTEVEMLLGPPVLDQPAAPARTRVWFLPRAVRALLAPCLAALVGERWIGDPGRFPALDPRITIADDPLVDGRPGSRPICDDGVPTRRRVLVAGGVPRAGILDLVTASRHGLPATGSGVRRGITPGTARFANLDVAGGAAGPAELAREVGDGYLVADLEVGPAPNPVTGVFRATAPWTCRIAAGEIVGRTPTAVLAGDATALLGRVVAVGGDAEWRGAARIPSLVLDGVMVELR